MSCGEGRRWWGLVLSSGVAVRRSFCSKAYLLVLFQVFDTTQNALVIVGLLLGAKSSDKGIRHGLGIDAAPEAMRLLKSRMHEGSDTRSGGHELWEIFMKPVFLLLAWESTEGERGHTWKGENTNLDRSKGRTSL